ncbi:hypothetical protein HKX48_004837 [Thoreauomyces humboldtii]|nr:hypothetical protein HKX48_004837 [Thoreauomyces humboldtii]
MSLVFAPSRLTGLRAAATASTHLGLLSHATRISSRRLHVHVPSALETPNASPTPSAPPLSGPHPKLTPDPNVDPFRTSPSAPTATTTASGAAPKAAERKRYVPLRPVYSKEELDAITVTHRPLQGFADRIAYSLVRVMRFAFDTTTNYSDTTGKMTEKQWLTRIVFLETVAGVPDEAQNERMHLLSFLKVKQPSIPFRAMVLLGQGVFFNLFFASYLLSPRTCHRFVGYLEESAVHTYTSCLRDIEAGQIKHWATTPAPEIAVEYWQLGEKATLRDMVAAVRADEAEHRDVNHTLAGLKPDDPNPF